MISAVSAPATSTVACHLAVAHHRGGLGDLPDLAHTMADIDHRDAGGGQAAHGLEQELDLGGRERTGRLVEDDELWFADHDAGDLDELSFGRAQLRDAPTRIERQSEPGQCLARPMLHFAMGEHAHAGRPAAEEQVLGNAHADDQAEFLIDGPHTEPGRFDRALGARSCQRCAVDRDLAAVGHGGPGQQSDQSRFSRAVLAEQGADFAPADLEIDIVQRQHAGIALGGATHRGDQGLRVLLAGGLHRWSSRSVRRRKCGVRDSA